MDRGKQLARDWYGTRWKTLRSNLINACVRHADQFLDDLNPESTIIQEASEAYFHDMMMLLSSWVPEDQLEMWKSALPLLSNKDRFSKWVIRDIDALSGTKVRNGRVVSKKQALGQLLWQFFELARRELESMGRGVSVARIKTWERLDKISRQLPLDSPNAEIRCTDEHFFSLSIFVKQNYANDRNLPRKVSTIREYFYEFSDSCYVIGVSSDIGISDRFVDEEWSYIAQPQETIITDSLKTLTDLERACLDVEFGTKLCSVTYTNKKAFIAEHGLSDDTFNIMLEAVLERALPLVQETLAKGLEELNDD